MYYLKNIWMKARYSSLHRVFLDAIARLGILITPFYVVLEGLMDKKIEKFEQGFEEYDIGFLGPEDMNTIAKIPGHSSSRKELLGRLNEGKRCFGLKYHDELAAFTWCDFDKCHFKGYRFSLKEDEAYLFDAYTLIDFRGKGIAPYIRYQLYKELAKQGRKKLYSISGHFNRSTIQFKRKLNAKLLKSFVTIGLFKKWYFTFQLRMNRKSIELP